MAINLPPFLSPTDRLDLFLLVGQSNMVGRAPIEPQDQIPHPRVWTFTREFRWARAIDPLHVDEIKPPGTGLGLTFGKTVAASNPDIFIGLIPCAVGGTSIDQWDRGGELYNTAITRTLAASKHGAFRAILWHQGESDSSADKVKEYLPKLDALIADLRADLSSPDLDFIAGQIGDWDSASNEFNHQLLNLPKMVPHTACVLSDGLASLGDNTHFDAPSLRELGRRYAAAYLKLIAK
jgi:hypothetical protein